MKKIYILILCMLVMFLVAPVSSFAITIPGWSDLSGSISSSYSSIVDEVPVSINHQSFYEYSISNSGVYQNPEFMEVEWNIPFTIRLSSVPTTGYIAGDFGVNFIPSTEMQGTYKSEWVPLSDPQVSFSDSVNSGGFEQQYSRLVYEDSTGKWQLYYALGPSFLRTHGTYNFTFNLTIKQLFQSTGQDAIRNTYPTLDFKNVSFFEELSYTTDKSKATDYGSYFSDIVSNQNDIFDLLNDYITQQGDSSGVNQGNNAFQQQESQYHDQESDLLGDAATSIDQVDFNTTSMLQNYAVSTKFFMDLLDGHIEAAGGFWFVVVFGFMLSFVFFILRLRR